MSYRCHSSTTLLMLAVVWLLQAIGCATGISKAALPINMVHQSNSSELVEEQQQQLVENATMRCDDARLRCAYRTGCGRALQQYLTLCASVLHGDVNDCPEICQHALIGLMSTDEGKELMTVSVYYYYYYYDTKDRIESESGFWNFCALWGSIRCLMAANSSAFLSLYGSKSISVIAG